MEESVKRKPQYAIVKLPKSADPVEFYKLMLDRGFPEVSFVNEVRREAFLPHEPPISVTATAPSLHDQLGSSSKQSHSGANHRVHADHSPVQRYPSYPSITESGSGQIRSQRSNPAMDAVELSESPEPLSDLTGSTLYRDHNDKPKRMEETLQEIRRATGLAGMASRNPVGPNRLSAVPVPETPEPLPRMRMTTGHYKASASSYGILGHLISDSVGDSGEYTGSTYSTCQLCQNKIMATRLSNLTNHVRRHAVMKQYKCRHCDYGHNEQAKVRLHMNHNHHDFESQPTDMLCYEMQLQWTLLMEKCFPEQAKRFGPGGDANRGSYEPARIPASQDHHRELRDPRQLSQGNLRQNVELTRTYTCSACGEMIMGAILLDHLGEAHHNECIPFACSECGYQAVSQRKVHRHIAHKHPTNVANVTVKVLSAGSNDMLFLQKFFPEIVGTTVPENSTGAERAEPKTNAVEAEVAKCEMCGESAVAKPMSNLLSHAKRHHIIKQFRCSECGYGSVEFDSMRRHMAQEHPGSQSEPDDLISEELKAAWIETTKKCFPKLQEQITGWWKQWAPFAVSNRPQTPKTDEGQQPQGNQFDSSYLGDEEEEEFVGDEEIEAEDSNSRPPKRTLTQAGDPLPEKRRSIPPRNFSPSHSSNSSTSAQPPPHKTTRVSGRLRNGNGDQRMKDEPWFT